MEFNIDNTIIFVRLTKELTSFNVVQIEKQYSQKIRIHMWYTLLSDMFER